MSPKIDTMFIDFFCPIPNLTHFLAPEKLQDYFGFFQNPELYHKEYLNQAIEGKPSRYFIHRMGSLRPIVSRKLRYSFWRNLFGGTSLNDYINSYLEGDGYFGYLPFIIPSSWKIYVEPSSLTDTKKNKLASQILNQAKVTLTTRLFPMGATSIHLMIFFHTEPADVEEFVNIQKMLLRYPIFRVARKSAIDSHLFTLEEIFKEVQNNVYDSLYKESPQGRYEKKPGGIHRVIYPHFVQANMLTDVEVKQAAASLIGLKTLKTSYEVDRFVRQSARGLESGDLLIFHPMATILHAPNTNPDREGYCFWNNYLNVVELATLQNFILKNANYLLEHALSPTRNFKEFADHASTLEGLALIHQDLRGGHKVLYKKIDQELELSEGVRVKFLNLLKNYRQLQSQYKKYELIQDQILSIEKILEKTMDVASDINLSEDAIKILLSEMEEILIILQINVSTLQKIEERERLRSPWPDDITQKENAMRMISSCFSKFRLEYLPEFENVIQDLLDEERKIAKIDITYAVKNLRRAKKDKDRSINSYIKELVKIATEVLNAHES
jgi:hypothetical protein